MFAKLYRSNLYDQILVVLNETNQDGCPEVRFYIEDQRLGVCSAEIAFEPTQTGYEEADVFFMDTDLELAEIFVEDILLDMIEAEKGVLH